MAYELDYSKVTLGDVLDFKTAVGDGNIKAISAIIQKCTDVTVMELSRKEWMSIVEQFASTAKEAMNAALSLPELMNTAVANLDAILHEIERGHD